MSSERLPDRTPESQPANHESPPANEDVLRTYLAELVVAEREGLRARADEWSVALKSKISREARTRAWLVCSVAIVGIGALVVVFAMAPHLAGSRLSSSSGDYRTLAILTSVGVAFIVLAALASVRWIYHSARKEAEHSVAATEWDRKRLETFEQRISSILPKHR